MEMHRLVGSSELLTMNRAGVQEKRDLLEILWAQFEKEHYDLVNVLGSSEKERMKELFSEVHGLYIFIKKAFHRRMEKLNAEIRPDNEIAPSVNRRNRSNDVQIVVPIIPQENNNNVNERDIRNVRNRIGPIRNNRRLASVVHQIGPNDLRLRLNRLQNAEPSINPNILCYNCNGDHPIRKCELFHHMKLTGIMDRLNFLQLCNNCFGKLNDSSHQCPHGHCHRCGIRVFHNSLICPRNPVNQSKL